ncbi:MAG: gamma-glutamyl-gamma-aminobutyrate hydrolase family protein [Phycisphaerae bacterium]|nr:gamma-glutamyl-gamma-aminobutyrate hydrolase family protein [Phycisphaerae bacterium]
MPTLLIDHSPRVGSTGLLGQTLREYGHRINVVRVAPAGNAAGSGADALPSDLDDVDAIVLSDGPQTLASNPPAFVAAESALIKAAHARQMPILGLGFGARLLATALGGEVAAQPDAGWLELKLTFPGREDPLYKGVPWTSTACFCQAEAITKLPEGATPFAHAGQPGTKPNVRAFAAGVFAFGVEHLFGLTDETFDHLLASQGDLLGRVPGGADSLRNGWREYGQTSMRIGQRIAESIALYLMPVDRMSAGRVKDLHY